MLAPCIYTIALNNGFLARTRTPSGNFKSVTGSNFSKVWFTVDKLEAEKMDDECRRRGAYNRFAMGTGIIEVPNTDGAFDHDIEMLNAAKK